MPQLLQFKPNRWQWLIALGLSAMLFVIELPMLAADNPQQDIRRLDAQIEQAIAKAEAKDFQGASNAFEQYKNDWFNVEDGLRAAKPDKARVLAALQSLSKNLDSITTRL